jgi:carboxynorspermidine decarboxylase
MIRHLTTPYYLIDERKLLRKLKIIRRLREVSGAKSLLALKCFSTWSVFGLIREYMDGTTSSSAYEAQLGHEYFGKEVHAYSVAFSNQDIKVVGQIADKVIFNSISQLKMYCNEVRGLKLGLRVNPGISYSHFDLADPARKYSRLGVSSKNSLIKASPLISGIMFHFNCENDDFSHFSRSLDYIGHQYGSVLRQMEWVSLGGGIAFTNGGYPLGEFCEKLKQFSAKYGVQVYLEPGDATVAFCAELVTTVLDIVHNKIDIAIVDASTEAHMLDLLVYQEEAPIKGAGHGKYRYVVAGRSCLAGDIFGTYRLPKKLRVGDIVKIGNAARYTMVKKNWFNGLPMPAICIKRLDGTLDMVRSFGYKDYVSSLS